MAYTTILSEKQSTVGSPYAFYTVAIEEVAGSRTSTTVDINIRIKWHLQYYNSYWYSGHTKTAYLYLNGNWFYVTLKDSDTLIEGDDVHTSTRRVTVTGLTASQKSITGIKFRVETNNDNYRGGTMSETACTTSSMKIETGNSPSSFTLSSTSVNLGSSITASINRVVSSNTHRLWMYGKTSGGDEPSYWVSNEVTGTSATCTFPAADFGYCFGKTSTSITKYLYLNTYDSSGNKVGQTYKSVTLKMPSSVGAPTGLGVSTTSVSKGVVKFKITAPTCKYGAYISSYTCTSSVGTVTRDGTTVTVEVPSNTSSTSVKLTVTAKDSRGFTVSSSATASYNAPSTFTVNTTSVNLGSSITATISKAVSSNTHRLWADSKDSSGADYDPWVSEEVSGTSATCTFSTSNFAYLFASNKTKATTTLYLNTYNSSGTNIGKASKTITLKMPSSVGAPTGLAVAHSSTSKGKVVFTITPPTCKYGATVSSYSCVANIGTVSRSGTTVTVTVPSGASSSTVKLTVTATDSRGFTDTASKSVSYNGASTLTIDKSSYTTGDYLTTTLSKWVGANTTKYMMSSGDNTYEYSSTYTGSSLDMGMYASRFGNWIPTNSKSTTLTLKATTYNSSGTSLGSSSKSFTLTLSEEDGAPTGLGLTRTSYTTTSMTFTITPPSYKYGASWSSYKIETTVGTATRSGNTITVTYPEDAALDSLKLSVTATDTRGFKSNAAVYNFRNILSDVCLYNSNGLWGKYIPYVYTSSGWKRMTKYVYKNSEWTR